MNLLLKISVLSLIAVATLIGAGSAEAAARRHNPLLTQGIIFVGGNPPDIAGGTLGDLVSLNPQPLPPRYVPPNKFSFSSPGDVVTLNPQPEPPGVY